MGILGRGTHPEEVGRVPLEVLEGRTQAPSVAMDKGDTGPSDRGPDTAEGSLGSSGTAEYTSPLYESAEHWFGRDPLEPDETAQVAPHLPRSKRGD